MKRFIALNGMTAFAALVPAFILTFLPLCALGGSAYFRGQVGYGRDCQPTQALLLRKYIVMEVAPGGGKGQDTLLER